MADCALLSAKGIHNVDSSFVKRGSVYEGAIWPQFDEDEIAAVVEVLRSGKVNQWTGGKVKDFQQQFAERMGGGRGLPSPMVRSRSNSRCALSGSVPATR